MTIHYSPGVEWHTKGLPLFAEGLARIGLSPVPTTSRSRISADPAVLFGTTFFTAVEEAPGDWLLVDRASYGDPDFVQLGWNGHGGRGDHKVPERITGARFASHGIRLQDYKSGSKVILCGQERAYTDDWRLAEWYKVRSEYCTHFKPHPAVPVSPVLLPVVKDFEDCELAVTLNSSVAIECMINGIPVVVDDPGGMAYGVSNRQEFFEWLAWTQWSWREIQGGIEHLWQAV